MIWTPVLGSDRAADAEERSGEWSDPRSPQYWDVRGRLAELFAGPLGISAVGVTALAWDVYLLYPPGVRWEDGDPPLPSHLEHQLWALAETYPNGELDPDSLSHALAVLLEEASPTAPH